MATQLSIEQERRIQAIVDRGAYSSMSEALDAAVSAVEMATAPDFEGSQEELEALLLEGLHSPMLSEAEFWNAFEAETGAMLRSHARAGKS